MGLNRYGRGAEFDWLNMRDEKPEVPHLLAANEEDAIRLFEESQRAKSAPVVTPPAPHKEPRMETSKNARRSPPLPPRPTKEQASRYARKGVLSKVLADKLNLETVPTDTLEHVHQSALAEIKRYQKVVDRVSDIARARAEKLSKLVQARKD